VSDLVFGFPIRRLQPRPAATGEGRWQETKGGAEKAAMWELLHWWVRVNSTQPPEAVFWKLLGRVKESKGKESKGSNLFVGKGKGDILLLCTSRMSLLLVFPVFW